MIRARHCLPPAALMFVALGCHAPSFTYDRPEGPGLAGVRTLALDPRPDVVVFVEGERQVADRPMMEAAWEGLLAKGYQPAPAADADLWVSIHVLVPARGPGRMEAPEGGGRGGHGRGGRGGGGGGGVEGFSGAFTLIVDLVSRKTQKRIWLGAVEAQLDHPQGTPESDAELRGLVSQLLSPLPAAGGA